jgi:hypothetical protein
MNALKNWLIRKLINKTAIDAGVIYSVIRKCSKGEIEHYVKMYFEGVEK